MIQMSCNKQNNLFLARENQIEQAKQGFSCQKFTHDFISESFLAFYKIKSYILGIDRHNHMSVGYLNFKKHWIDNVPDDIQ